MTFWKRKIPDLPARDQPVPLRCSFCKKSQRDVQRLIAGPDVYICDECVDICLDILRESRVLDSGSQDATADSQSDPVSGGLLLGAIVPNCSLCHMPFPLEDLTPLGPRGFLCGPCVDAVRMATDPIDDDGVPDPPAT